jgi:hypothetical protein
MHKAVPVHCTSARTGETLIPSANHALIPNQANFQLSALLYGRQQGNNTVDGEVDLRNRLPGFK